jgi:ubiquinone biosynthesis monooxygenase Coq7
LPANAERVVENAAIFAQTDVMDSRDYTAFDRLVMNFDQALRTLAGKPLTTGRFNPADDREEEELSVAERAESEALMRINHCGEVTAQALYQGQALTARLGDVRERMERAAEEENDHLAWCEQRIDELGGRLSYLNPLWYAGSFAIGAAAGAVGDKWSLGFVAETEKQVIDHIEEHLQRIPAGDHKSRAILEQMKIDEAHHGAMAKAAGGAELPAPVKGLMQVVSKIMTGTSYYL